MLPLLEVPHLDREFDYLVPAELDAHAQPGVRVRVRFSGRLVDGYILARIEQSTHAGKLAWLHKVVSPVPVLPPDLLALVERVARRSAGTRADVLRLAIPPRHARVENEDPPATVKAAIPDPSLDAWQRYEHADSYLAALAARQPARAVWNPVPGEQWWARLAEAAAATAAAGRGVIVVVPDQNDLDRVGAACAALIGAEHVAILAAGLGPTERYRRWLAVLRGDRRVVVGTRSAIFAPIHDLGLVILWDDGDDSLWEPRSPYPHARDVAVHRAHLAGAGLLLGAFSRTCEAQLLVETGWAHALVAPRDEVRRAAPRVVARADSDIALERDPAARAARIPAFAFQAARAALERGEAVLIQVPRRGYLSAVACQDCREPLRCRRCAGPMELRQRDGAYSCRWCGTAEQQPRCRRCGSVKVRATVIGAKRTAEELGRAFPGVAVITSTGGDGSPEVAPGAALVISTPGVEPPAEGGYGAVLLLDGWLLLGLADLRGGEIALRKWMAAAALARPASMGGMTAVMADPENPVVQAMVRWDPGGFAAAELRGRAEVGFPPAVRMAVVDGTHAAVSKLLEVMEVPDGAEVLGPVPLPWTARPPVIGESVRDEGEVERVLVRVPRTRGAELSDALRAAQAVCSSRRETSAVRVQIDPLNIG
ncbi:primosomal protein N' [Lolliginicoccus suaedae]|uniref:primosomal protein N' n=1 Tax=Lolliginicoccus suaedae TaxID=2605429 RepID=UPI0011EE35BC|nr:primosomal protein N' [Lolliginicoccus suaedae]